MITSPVHPQKKLGSQSQESKPKYQVYEYMEALYLVPYAIIVVT
jgi:hypothetical protein